MLNLALPDHATQSKEKPHFIGDTTGTTTSDTGVTVSEQDL
jgi:hypothetical protein